MVKMTADEIRESFLKFFESKEHLRLPSYSLVPVNDPTLLIINAGMAPMKPYFKGEAAPPRRRVTTCQKCVRVGDIEQVGKTARHYTFFEMLGNFSFGDYFKKEAISWGWEYIVDVLKIPADKLYVTIHTDDDEAERLWLQETPIKKERISRLEDNFWGPVGDTGPCGPCSEILIDLGEEMGCGSPDCKPGCDCDRYLEIWNLVFTGLNKNEKGEFEKLPSPCIDTGLGFERLVAYLHGKRGGFETEIFQGIIGKISQITGRKLGDNPQNDVYIRIIADHIRSVVFMASDGITPSNESRGYVMRRLLRRSVRMAGILGFKEHSLSELVEPVLEKFGHIYPTLREKKDFTMAIISTEEDNFKRTLAQGTDLLENMLKKLKKEGKNILAGADVFSLYDTYGFPHELTDEIASESGFSVDMEGFKASLEEQRNRARSDLKNKLDAIVENIDLSGYASEFTGYERLSETTKISAIFVGGKPQNTLSKGQEGELVFEKTSFYGESGGQVGDSGKFRGDKSSGLIKDTFKTAAGINLHRTVVEEGELKVGDQVEIAVDEARRNAIKRHHTATHLLQSALREVLGGHVGQMGSHVDENRLRFDFSHHGALSNEEILRIETLVNEAILSNIPVQIDILPVKEAMDKGALAFFGEKYGEVVRVVSAQDVSTELCGGTHVSRSGDIGCFKVLSESAIGMGTRRIEAVCGLVALQRFQMMEGILKETSHILKVDFTGIPEVVVKTKDNLKEIEKELKQVKSNMLVETVDKYLVKVDLADDKVLYVGSLDDVNRDDIRDLADKVATGKKMAFIVLGSVIEDKVALIVRLTDDLVKQGFSSVPLIKDISSIFGGSGGGRPQMAQSGGKDPDKMREALEAAPAIIKNHIEKMKVTK